MKVATARGQDGTNGASVRQAIRALENALGTTPDMVFFHGAQDCVPKDVAKALKIHWPKAHLHGGSTCMGVMTRGHFQPDPKSFGFFGISDSEGAYGVGIAALGPNPRETAKEALTLALEDARRPGEIPAMIMLTAVPGWEEELILGIADMVGAHVPVVGGSAGDETVTGQWWVSANGVVDKQSVVVTTLFPSTAVVSSFQSGYEVTESSGLITRATGRIIHEIDSQPAAEVYNGWTGGAISDIVKSGGKIVQRISALHPVGRRVGLLGEVFEFVLSFLDSANPDGSLNVFTEVKQGEQLWLMRGTDNNLVERAGRITQVSLDALVQERGNDDVVGALVIYCASCLVYIRDRMPEVVAGLDAALGDRPYLGLFSFGEQGCFLDGGNRHGNMMVTVILFTQNA